ALSDPPYYTACPNPFLGDLLDAESSRETPPVVDPFAADVHVSRHDAYSLAHTYHTKVPPPAIAQYIEHYTRPGDVVLDCFCGSGMTGLAAAGAPWDESQNRPLLTAACPRHAVLMDLSPAATHIAAGYAARVSEDDLAAVATLLGEVRATCTPLFDLPHRGEQSRLDAWAGHARHIGRVKGDLEYLVWSEILICPRCDQDVVFGSAAFEATAARVSPTFSCPHCRRRLRKRACAKRMEEYHDPFLNRDSIRPRRIPLFTAYCIDGQRYYRLARH